MIAFNIVYVTVLLAASFISAFLCSTALRRRHSEHAVPFMILIGCVSFWTLFQALMFIENDLRFKMIFANLRYIAIEVTPIAYFAMASAYKNKGSSLSYKKWLALLAFPFICYCILWTDSYHHMFYSYTKLVDGQFELGSGPFFWINYAYLQFFIIYGIILFISSYLQSTAIYKKQAGMIVLAAVIPNMANLAFNLNLLPFKNADVTPISFFISSILFFYLLFQYKLFDIVPIARESLIESMDDLIIVLDNNKRVLDLNTKAISVAQKESIIQKNKEFFGMDIKEVFGKWKEFMDIFYDTSTNIEETKCLTYNSQETPRYFHINKKDILDKKGKKEGELIVLRDVTALEEALSEAKNAKDAAEFANKAKGYFLANMSHEIRTPMNAIIGMSDILYSSDLDSKIQKEYLRMITGSAQSLLTIINDILDFSKIEAGKMIIESVRINFKQLVKDTVEAFMVSSINPCISISYNIDPSIPDSLMGDPVRLRQALTNVIGNAVKFTEKGKVSVDVYVIDRNKTNITLGITISDTGIGIPNEKINSLFESFNQLDGSTTRRFGGTGLGLAIVKNLIELMKGTISVKSEPGVGSNFMLQIPFEVPDQAAFSIEADKQEHTLSNEKDLSKLRILVTEDNKINQEIIKAYLKKAGCSYEFADNGKIALNMYEEKEYDIILMDVQMPVMDGLEATAKIREKEKSKGTHIPIIALTAGAMNSDIEQCIKAGMDKHLSKPVKAGNLYEMLRDFA